MSETYKTGTASCGGGPRWFFEFPDGEQWYYDSEALRDQALAYANAGRRYAATQVCRVGVGPANYYEHVRYDPTQPAEHSEEYVALVKALRDEARRRNWCGEWETFAKGAGIPEELLRPATPNKDIMDALPIGSVVRLDVTATGEPEPHVWHKQPNGWQSTAPGRTMGPIWANVDHPSGRRVLKVLYNPEEDN